MARPLRILYPGAWYHVMNRGGRHRTIFQEDSDRHGFLRLLGETVEMWNIEIHAYSLLDTHYHLLIRTPDANLSRAMRHIDGVYTQRFNLWHNFDGQLFRGRYKSILIDKNNYLLEVTRYIHLQAVRAELVKSPEDHWWSSHRIYLLRQSEHPWLSTKAILDFFNTGKREAQRRLDTFVKKGIPPEVEQFYSKKRLAPILGSKEFIQKIKEDYILPVKLSYEIPAAKITASVPIEVIKQEVCRIYKVSLTDLNSSVRGRRNEARNMAVYLSRKIGGHSLNEIADSFECKYYTGVSSIIRRFEQRVGESKPTAQLTKLVKQQIRELQFHEERR